jgi:hypothetical protein
MIVVLGFESRRGLEIFLFTTASRTALGAHPTSYPMGTRGAFPAGKAAGAWSWPLTPSSSEVKECVELYLHSPNTPPWRGAQLKHRDNLTFYLYWMTFPKYNLLLLSRSSLLFDSIVPRKLRTCWHTVVRFITCTYIIPDDVRKLSCKIHLHGCFMDKT